MQLIINILSFPSSLQSAIFLISAGSKILSTEVVVLVEKVSIKDDEMLKGRTSCWKNVIFPGKPELFGTLQNVRVHSYSNQTLIGEIVPPAA